MWRAGASQPLYVSPANTTGMLPAFTASGSRLSQYASPFGTSVKSDAASRSQYAQSPAVAYDTGQPPPFSALHGASPGAGVSTTTPVPFHARAPRNEPATVASSSSRRAASIRAACARPGRR